MFARPPTFVFRLVSCFVGGLAALFAGVGCSHTPRQRPLVPSAALEKASCLSDAGDDAHALSVLSQALCQPGQKAAPSRATLERKVALLGAWVRAWDVAGRDLGSRAEVMNCLAGSPLAPLAAMVLADATGAWEEVIAVGEKVLPGAQPPLRGEFLLRHAVATMHQGRTARAVALLSEAIAEAPDHPDLYVALAQGREALGLYDGVRPALLPLLGLAQAPQGAVLARARGILNAAREAAAPPMTAADMAEHVDLTNVAASPETNADDLAHVRHIAAHTQQPRLYALCALVLLRAGDPATGRALLERAADAMPMDPDPSRLLAVHRLTENDWDGALMALAEAVRRSPFDVESQVMLASVASRVGAHALAVRAYSALVRLEPHLQAHRDGLAHSQRMAQLEAMTPPGKAPAPASKAQNGSRLQGGQGASGAANQPAAANHG